MAREIISSLTQLLELRREDSIVIRRRFPRLIRLIQAMHCFLLSEFNLWRTIIEFTKRMNEGIEFTKSNSFYGGEMYFVERITMRYLLKKYQRSQYFNQSKIAHHKEVSILTNQKSRITKKSDFFSQ